MSTLISIANIHMKKSLSLTILVSYLAAIISLIILASCANQNITEIIMLNTDGEYKYFNPMGSLFSSTLLISYDCFL